MKYLGVMIVVHMRVLRPQHVMLGPQLFLSNVVV